MRFIPRLHLVLALTSMPAFSACFAADASEADVDEVGTLSLPLSGTSGSGSYTLYGTFSLSKKGSTATPSKLPSSGGFLKDDVTVELDAGEYTIKLNDGWFLSRPGGLTPSAVSDVTLVSPLSQTFKISDLITTTVSYKFKVGGEFVSLERGALTVDLEVDDTQAGNVVFKYDNTRAAADSPAFSTTGATELDRVGFQELKSATRYEAKATVSLTNAGTQPAVVSCQLGTQGRGAPVFTVWDAPLEITLAGGASETMSISRRRDITSGFINVNLSCQPVPTGTTMVKVTGSTLFARGLRKP